MVTIQVPKKELAVCEIFGPTLQGEGPSAGRQAIFLRMMQCNLHCVWCDTPYTWDRTKYDLKAGTQWYSAEFLAETLQSIQFSADLLVITGGEPLLQQKFLMQTIWNDGRMRMLYPRYEFETNGTIMPHPDLQSDPHIWFNVSPKLENSGNMYSDATKPEVLRMFGYHPRSVFKFPMQGPEEFNQVDNIVKLAGIPPERVWVMPVGVSTHVVISKARSLVDGALERGYNLTLRQHILLWGNERGK